MDASTNDRNAHGVSIGSSASGKCDSQAPQ